MPPLSRPPRPAPPALAGCELGCPPRPPRMDIIEPRPPLPMPAPCCGRVAAELPPSRPPSMPPPSKPPSRPPRPLWAAPPSRPPMVLPPSTLPSMPPPLPEPVFWFWPPLITLEMTMGATTPSRPAMSAPLGMPTLESLSPMPLRKPSLAGSFGSCATVAAWSTTVSSACFCAWLMPRYCDILPIMASSSLA